MSRIDLKQKPIALQYPDPSSAFQAFLANRSCAVRCSDYPGIRELSTYTQNGLAGTLPRMMAREALMLQLQDALKKCAPAYKLWIYDAFRTKATQLALFNSIYESIKAKHPLALHDELMQRTRQFVAHPEEVSRFAVPPHNSGGTIQAVDSKGSLWFKTREQGEFIEFCIGNSNSYIPPENLPKLFEAFFTSGKRGGTGLRLAIAQKMVTAHGGKIWCESGRCEAYPQGRVEFFFTLPLAHEQINKSTAKLPLHSREIERHLEVASDEFDHPHIDELEGAVLRACQALGRPLKVLFVDDEVIYRNALASLLTKSVALTKSVDFLFAENGARALNLAIAATPDLIVTDVDLGRESMNGTDFVRMLHGEGRSSALICVNSNRLCNSDSRTALEVGAEVFLPKLMARAQLLKLLLQAGRRAENR